MLQHVSPIEWDNVILHGQYVLDRARVRQGTGPYVVFQHECGRYPIKSMKMTTACVKLEFRLFTAPGDGEKTDKLPVQIGFALYLKSQ